MGKCVVFRSARVFDGESEALRDGVNVFVEGGVVREISERPADAGDEVVECGGRVLMPGLIDAHVHVYAAGLNIVRVVQSPMSYLAHFAAQFLHSSLDRGFTTLRDVGGADIGLVLAIKDGLLERVPRLFYGGRVISQTGGHGDFRPGDHSLETGHFCGCSYHADQLAVIADGADAVRKAVREEFRRGLRTSRLWRREEWLRRRIRWIGASTRMARFALRWRRLTGRDSMWLRIVIRRRRCGGRWRWVCARSSMRR